MLGSRKMVCLALLAIISGECRATTLEEWRKDEHGMYIATSLDEMQEISQLAFLQQHLQQHKASSCCPTTTGTSPSPPPAVGVGPFSMSLTWVEDAECSIQQNDTIVQSIHSAVEELVTSHRHIPTIRWTLSDTLTRMADAQFLNSANNNDSKNKLAVTETPGLLITTRNGTDSFIVEYSGSYHHIPDTVHHYFDWLTLWSTSIYGTNTPSISLAESKPKTFRTTQDILNYYWDQINTSLTSSKITNNPLLLVYYHQDLSLCQTKNASTELPWNATLVKQETKIFEMFAIVVAGRRDRYFFYSYDCHPKLQVYDPSLGGGILLYTWDRSSSSSIAAKTKTTSINTFLVQASSDAMILFHRELTAPIAMAHDIQIVALPGVLDEATCRQWKRRNRQIICMVVEPHEYRIIASLGLQPDFVVIVDADLHVHVQPAEISLDEFVELTLFRRPEEVESSVSMLHSKQGTPTPDHGHSGGITWIEEQTDAVFPDHGIVVAISRTCGHCQRILAIFRRLEGLLNTLGWTDELPLFVVDVAKTDIVQPLWLPTVYYNRVESPKRSFYDETEILEWVFSQMLDDEVVALQHKVLL